MRGLQPYTYAFHLFVPRLKVSRSFNYLYPPDSLPNQIFAGINYAKKAEDSGAASETSPGEGLEPIIIPSDESSPNQQQQHQQQQQQQQKTRAESTAATAATALGIKVAPVTFAWCLHAYVLTRAGAQRLVSLLPVTAPADIFVGSLLAATDGGLPRLTGRAVLPVLATAGGPNAAGGDIVSSGTNRAGVADGFIKGMMDATVRWVVGGGKKKNDSSTE